MYETVSDFYDGKSIFLTGATGYLGSVLLEILLRCLPKINNVYLLLRPKNGLEPSDRKKEIFRKEIFKKLLQKSPDITDKVKEVFGDILLPGLGINDTDLLKITQEVSVVIHCAALLTFTLPFRISIQGNVLGTKSIIELCRKLKKGGMLVYTSTLFSNTHLKSKYIEEKCYKLPFSLDSILTDLDNKDDEWFSQFLSKYNCKWPNSYTFSKSVAENVLFDEAADLPVVIVRPSIILGTLNGPSLGYIERGFGSIEMPVAVGTGLISVLRLDTVKMHIIPVDITANTIIVSTWLLATKRVSGPYILNLTCSELWDSRTSEYVRLFLKIFKKNILPNTIQIPTYTYCKNYILYRGLRIYKDLIPCMVIDAVAHFKGSNFRLMPIQKKLDNLMSVLSYFTLINLTVEIEEFKNISRQLHPDDRKIFYTDLTGTTFEDLINNFSYSSALFNWEKDKFSPMKRKHLAYANTMVMTFIKRSFLFLIIGLLYVIVSKLYC